MEEWKTASRMKSISLTKMVFVLAITSTEGGPWLPKKCCQGIMGLHRGGSSSSEQQLNCTNLMYSVWSVPGARQYMEDEYYVSGDGSFAAVFDGHGGGAVSRSVWRLSLRFYCCVAMIEMNRKRNIMTDISGKTFMPTTKLRYQRLQACITWQKAVNTSP